MFRAIYKPGYRYVKAGYMLMNLRERGVVQGSLFDAAPPAQDVPREKLIGVLDKANGRWGRGTVGSGIARVKDHRGWAMAEENLSPCYTTSWEQLREIV